MSATDIALCLLTIAHEKGIGITNLHLQKMLYYAQGFSYAFEKAPLFNDDFQAWEYGPAIPGVYSHFQGFAAEPIGMKWEDFGREVDLPPETRSLLEDVVDTVGRKDPWALVAKTRRERPWKKNYRHWQSAIIPKEDIRQYFCEVLASKEAVG